MFVCGNSAYCCTPVFAYSPEQIVTRDGKKYTVVESFLDTYAKYYDYINLFIMSDTARIEEYYGKVRLILSAAMF